MIFGVLADIFPYWKLAWYIQTKALKVWEIYTLWSAHFSLGLVSLFHWYKSLNFKIKNTRQWQAPNCELNFVKFGNKKNAIHSIPSRDLCSVGGAVKKVNKFLRKNRVKSNVKISSFNHTTRSNINYLTENFIEHRQHSSNKKYSQLKQKNRKKWWISSNE